MDSMYHLPTGLCDESITISLYTQKLPGADLDPKGSLNKIYDIIPMMVIAVTVNYHSLCGLLYEESRSFLLCRIGVFGYLS